MIPSISCPIGRSAVAKRVRGPTLWILGQLVGVAVAGEVEKPPLDLRSATTETKHFQGTPEAGRAFVQEGLQTLLRSPTMLVLVPAAESELFLKTSLIPTLRQPHNPLGSSVPAQTRAPHLTAAPRPSVGEGQPGQPPGDLKNKFMVPATLNVNKPNRIVSLTSNRQTH